MQLCWQKERAYLELCHVKFGSERNLISVCIQPGSSGYSDDQIDRWNDNPILEMMLRYPTIHQLMNAGFMAFHSLIIYSARYDITDSHFVDNFYP